MRRASRSFVSGHQPFETSHGCRATRFNPRERRIQAFLDANDAVLGTINRSAMRAELGAIVTALRQSSSSQAAGRDYSSRHLANQADVRASPA